MATKREYDAIKIIKSSMRISKRKKEKPIYGLCGDDEFYAKAVKSIRNAGAITAGTQIVGYLLLVAANIFTVINGQRIYDGYFIPSLIFILVIALVPCILGFKIYNLSFAPSGMLAALIVILILDLISFYSIFPIIAAIFVVVAIARWTAYRDWFYQIDVDYYRKGRYANKVKK